MSSYIDPEYVKERLEYLRGELRAERISYGELAELQGLARFIDPGDVELLEASGVPEFPEMDNDQARKALDDAIDLAMRFVPVGTWADAFLTHGGEATWDAVKDASRLAKQLREALADVAELEDQFENITPF